MMVRRRDLRIHVGILEQILISRLTIFVLAGIFVVMVLGIAIGLNCEEIHAKLDDFAEMHAAAFSEYFND